MLMKFKIPAICLAVLFTSLTVGCGKKHTPAPPPAPRPVNDNNTTPPPPPPPPPVTTSAAPVVAQFTAEPTSIQIGQSSTLRWQVTGDVSGVSIDQTIGTVQNTGNRRVFPSQPTTYTLTATGPGGTTTAQATVNVQAEAPPPVRTTPTRPSGMPPPGMGGSLSDVVTSTVQDVFFDYDQSEVRGDQQQTLTQDATALKAVLANFPNAIIMVEGHCDERGSAEYNLGLGDRRASAAKEFLVQLGIPADRLRTVSYGKERPQCTESDEACWQKNRRVHFAPGQ